VDESGGAAQTPDAPPAEPVAPAPPAYGYPPSDVTQPAPAYAPAAPAYGYPQPAAAAAYAPDPTFRLPPMGPQFQRP
jgi:hypothetical protein